MESKNNIALIIIALVVGILVGGGTGYAISQNMDNKESNTTSMSVSEKSP